MIGSFSSVLSVHFQLIIPHEAHPRAGWLSPLPFVRCARVSEEQIERIQERRTRIKGLLSDLGESLRLVRDLQHSFEVNACYNRGRLSSNPL